MVKFSNQVARWSVFFILFLTGILCGCSFFDLHDLQSDGESLINGPEVGSANVAFNIVIPGRASLSPVIRAAETGAKVTFRITLLQPGNTSKPTITFLKTAVVQADGSATTSFTGLPEGSAIGEITIDGGNIGGKSLFHGASDLFPGDNTITVSPKGSLHQSDILANAMLAIAADPELIKLAKPNLVTNVANAAASLIASPDENVYAKVFEAVTQSSLTLNQSSMTQIGIFNPDSTIRGTSLNSWTVTYDQFFKDTILAGTGLVPVSLPRNGIGGFAIIAWENAGKSDFAFTSLDTASGTLRYFLKTAVTNGFTPGGSQIVMSDGSMVIAGSYNSRPTLVRWNGKENLDLSTGLTGTALTWKQVFEIAPVGTMTATISYLEYDLTGTGRILCSIKDPSAGHRQFSVDPLTGVAVEQVSVNNFGLWAQVGSGSVTLGWDPIEAAAKYRVYYATGTTLATATAPFIEENSEVLLFESLVNNQVYTFQVAAIDSQNKPLAWSTVIKATPLGAADPIIYASWKLATNTFEIGTAAMANVKITSYDLQGGMMGLEITGTSPFTPGSIITGVFNNQPVCVKLPFLGMQPPGPTPPGGASSTVVYNVFVTKASMEEVFEECKYVFRGKMSQLPALSEKLINTSDPAYSLKMNYLRRNMRPALRAGFTSPITASPSYGAISLEMENFELDPDVVVNFETSWGRISQFEVRVDGYAQCDIYAKLLASAGVELPVIEGTLLPHDEIPFFVGPVPGTWAREVTASWKMSLNAEVEVKAGTKMRIDFRSGANYYRETGWGGQLLWRVQNTPILEAKLQGTFSNEAAIEMKNALKVGGLAGPELTLKPYIKSEATVSTEKPCQVDAALTMGVEGALKAVVQAWSYNIGEWGSEFPVLGPWVIAQKTVTANATPTLTLTGPYNLENKLAVVYNRLYNSGYYPHVFTSTGTDSFALTMDDSKGLYRGIAKVEISVDGNPAFTTFNLDASTHSETGVTLTPYPEIATLTLPFPFELDSHMTIPSSDEASNKWYTPFRLPPGPHELGFKVYDRCGDFSIATKAIWIAAEPEIFAVKNDVGSISWEIGVKEYERGTMPERARNIEPLAGGLDLSPIKDGPIKYYDPDGNLMLEGTFTDNIRAGIWKRHRDESTSSSIAGSFAQIEFDSNGKPVRWHEYIDYIDGSDDRFSGIEPPSGGSADFAIKITDTGYIRPEFYTSSVCSFTAGIRTLGMAIATNTHHIETFSGGQRNGEATHSLYQTYNSSIELYKGEYLNDIRSGLWVIKRFVDLTDLRHTIQGSFENNQRSGVWTWVENGGPTISANYQNDSAAGSFSISWTDGNHSGGNYPVSGTEKWPIVDSGGNQVGTYTPQIEPIPLSSWPITESPADTNYW